MDKEDIDIVPFTLLGVAALFIIDKKVLIGTSLLALAVIYLFIYLIRQEKPNTRQIAIASAITLLFEVINIRVIKDNFYFGITLAIIIPIMALVFLMASNKDYRICIITYVLLTSFAFVALYYTSKNVVIAHLLFKLSLFIALICASSMKIEFGNEIKTSEEYN